MMRVGLYGAPAKINGADKKEKHLKYILLYLHEAEYVPRFVAYDIYRLPPISINHMDATAIVQEMNQLRLQMSSLCATVTSLLDGQLERKTQISLLQRKPTHVSTANTTVEPTSARCEPPPCEASGSRPEDISPMSNNTSDSSPTLAKMPVTPILPIPLLSPPPPMSPSPWSSFQQVSPRPPQPSWSPRPPRPHVSRATDLQTMDEVAASECEAICPAAGATSHTEAWTTVTHRNPTRPRDAIFTAATHTLRGIAPA